MPWKNFACLRRVMLRSLAELPAPRSQSSPGRVATSFTEVHSTTFATMCSMPATGLQIVEGCAGRQFDKMILAALQVAHLLEIERFSFSRMKDCGCVNRKSLPPRSHP